MCENRNWNRLEIKQHNDNIVMVFATRSDSLLISTMILFPKLLSTLSATIITKEALEELESYRNCKCTLETFCKLHITKDKKWE